MMKRRMLMWSVAVLLVAVAGCQTPRQRLRAAQETYQAVADSLITARQAGLIGDDGWQQVKKCFQTGADVLEKWKFALLAGANPVALIEAWNQALDDLLKIQAGARANLEGSQP